MRIAWDSVGDIVERVVADCFSEARFYGLVMIGVDEISYRRGQRYLTCVADHHSGAIVWAKPGRDAKTLQAFFELLGDRRHSITAISIDMSAGYENAIKAIAKTDERFTPEVVFDSFHVCQLGSQAVDQVRRAEWNEHDKSKTATGRWIKHSRWSLLKAPERQTEQQLARLAEVAATNKRLYRAFLLKEELRLLYHLPETDQAPEHRKAWLAWASPLPAQAIRQARPHRSQVPRRDPRRCPSGAEQRPADGPELQGPPDQPPQLRLPRPRSADQPHLPLRLRSHHPPTVHPQTVRRTLYDGLPSSADMRAAARFRAPPELLKLTPANLALAALIVALADWGSWMAGDSFFPGGPLDEIAHFLTALVVLWALGPRVWQRFLWPALIASVVIDLDHVPGRLGADFLTQGTPRPYTHSLLTIAVMLVAALTFRRRRDVFLGMSLGLAIHFFRDLSEPNSGVALLWPWSDRSFSLPHGSYVGAMAAVVLLDVYRLRSTGRARAKRSVSPRARRS